VIILDPPADIFASNARAIVIPTNCYGANGAGLAKMAAQRWPTWDRQYRALCKGTPIEPGSVHFFDVQESNTTRVVIALPTKDHWSDPSRLPWVEAGIRALADALHESNLSVAIPALGCGLGELQWDDVRPLLESILGPVEGADIRVYAPHPGRGRVAGTAFGRKPSR
jgi:O-acetyl-ADP-ribose deacetylase (regulator of RNase III)